MAEQNMQLCRPSAREMCISVPTLCDEVLYEMYGSNLWHDVYVLIHRGCSLLFYYSSVFLFCPTLSYSYPLDEDMYGTGKLYRHARRDILGGQKGPSINP